MWLGREIVILTLLVLPLVQMAQNISRTKRRDKEPWSGPYSDGGSHRTHRDSDNKNSSLEGRDGSWWEQAGRRKEVVGINQGKLSSPETSYSDSLTCWVGDTATVGRVWTGRYSDWTCDVHKQVMWKQVMFAIGDRKGSYIRQAASTCIILQKTKTQICKAI